MRIVFIGCVQFSYNAFEYLLNLECCELIGVVTRKYSAFNSDFCSLESTAKRVGIPCFLAEKNQQNDMAEWLRSLSPDVVYCFGWSYLLNKNILSIPKIGVVGYHPANLPKNRGRHPIIWALALGLTETASTFFFMDEGADSGDILSQEKIIISNDDDATSLYNKMTNIALSQLSIFTPQLALGIYERKPQDNKKANYWRKRSKKDGEIDWRMSSSCIYNLVRSLTKPYSGAHCIYEEKEVKIWKVLIVDNEFTQVDNIEPGKIIFVDDDDIIVKCGEGVIKVIAHEFKNIPDNGVYL